MVECIKYSNLMLLNKDESKFLFLEYVVFFKAMGFF